MGFEEGEAVKYVVLMNLGLAAAVCAAIFVTKSAWPLLGFVFAFGWKSSPKSGRCPACAETVVFEEKEEED